MSDTGPTRQVVALVRDRDHGCVRCGTGYNLTTQHRVSRGMGGSRHRPWVNRPANLLTLCGSGTTGCHGWVESHPTEAKEAGWALSRFCTAPEEAPVLYRKGWFTLDDEGGRDAVGGHSGGGGGGGGGPVHDQDVGGQVPGGAAASWPPWPPNPV